MDMLAATSLELEQETLSLLMERPSLISDYGISINDFSEPLHAEMFAQIQLAAQDGELLNATALGAKLASIPPIGDLTVPEYCRKVYTLRFHNVTPSTIQNLKDVATRRRIAALSESLRLAAYEPRTDIAAEAAAALSELDSVLASNRPRQSKAWFADGAADAIDAAMSEDNAARIMTGLSSLDTTLGGWHRGQYLILAGRPGMGKSMVAMSTALRAARGGANVLIFSLEMTNRELFWRMLSDLTFSESMPIPYIRAINRSLTERQAEIWAKARNQYAGLSLAIDDQRGLTISEIVARARRHAQELARHNRKLDLIVIDHMGLVRPSDRYRGSRVQEVTELSDGLATMAKDLDVCVLALSQLNRQTESRENKRPTLADLRDSGSIEQDAHVVMFTYRTAYYLERLKFDPGTDKEIEREALLEAHRNSLELIVAKNRNGPTATLNMFCDPGCNAVRDLA